MDKYFHFINKSPALLVLSHLVAGMIGFAIFIIMDNLEIRDLFSCQQNKSKSIDYSNNSNNSNNSNKQESRQFFVDPPRQVMCSETDRSTIVEPNNAVADKLFESKDAESQALAIALLATEKSTVSSTKLREIALNPEYRTDIRNLSIMSIQNDWRGHGRELIALIRDGSPEIRKGAILAANNLEDAEKAPALATALAGLQTEANSTVAISILELLRGSSESYQFTSYVTAVNNNFGNINNDWLGYVCSAPIRNIRPSSVICPD